MCECVGGWREVKRPGRAQGHATDTYDEFVAQNTEKLRALPPPRVALEYYMSGDLYLFDELQTTGTDPRRRPTCECASASPAACCRQSASRQPLYARCCLLDCYSMTAVFGGRVVLSATACWPPR